ncbi:MAG: ABC transporter permease [Burkholderiaceae bacterium]|jgi:putative ABC transport system permease protein|nr:ABC transporter permease [Burkholderiaceae bacterium]
MTAFIRLGWRMLWRDLRAGELRLLLLAVLLAVAALAAVGFFSDRLQRGLQRDARQLLGGDVVVVSDGPTPVEFIAYARALRLNTSSNLSFPTMARAADAQGGASKLVLLKAVAPGYPLRGQVRAAADLGQPDAPVQGIPARGQAWVDPGVLDALALKVGDPLLLGNAQFRITRVITLESDRGASFMSFASRVMMNVDDVPATALVQPASRLSYRFAVAGDARTVKAFEEWARARLKPGRLRGVQVESFAQGRPEMQQTLDRAGKFLRLVALLAALLSAVAVALAARSFANNHLDDCALLRVLGQSQRSIAAAYTFEFALAGGVAGVLGVALGFAVHWAFVGLLAGLIDIALPAPSVWPVGFGLGVGFTLLAAFALPPVLQLAQVPPLRVMRRDAGRLQPASAAVLGLGVTSFAALLLMVSGDLKLGLIAVGGFASAWTLFALLGMAVTLLLRHSVNERTAPRWLVLATRQVAARPVYAVVQISALAMGLLALALLVLLRTDLIASWRRATPPDAPNRFVINIMPDQGAAFQQALRDAGVRQFDWYPMFRGRLVAINGQPVSASDYADERAKRLVEREFNLSHAEQAPPYNHIAAGVWKPDATGEVSVEQGLAQTLRLKLGDRLHFDIGGITNTARITSLRKLDWGSLHVNFFVMYTVTDINAQIPGVPVTYISAFHVPAAAQGVDNALVRRFPNITSIDMRATLAQVQNVLDQIIRAVELLFGFTLAAGLAVLFACVTATREERAREFAIMRCIGARARLLRQVQRAELAGIGLLAGLLAGLAAVAIGWALAYYVFEFPWTVSPMVLLLPLSTALAGAALALGAGWWGLRDVLRHPVVQTLRRVGD